MDDTLLKNTLNLTHPITSVVYNPNHVIAAVEINLKNIERDRTSMSGREVQDNISDDDYNGLSSDKKSQVLALIASESINPFGFGVNVIKDIFNAQSDTITALALARIEQISHATFVGLNFVKAGDIERVRNM